MRFVPTEVDVTPASAAVGESRPPALALVRQMADAVRTHPAVRGGRLAAIERMMRWQWAHRRGARRARVQVGPMRFVCHRGSTMGSALLYFGLPEYHDMTFVLRYLRAGDRVIDVGANIGVYSVLAATAAPDVEIVAAEPDPVAAARFEEHAALNGLARWTLHRVAVTDAPGPVTFTRGRDVVNRIARAGDHDVVEVPATALDALAAGRAPALVKIDVEGTERSVLASGPSLLAAAAPVLLFEINEGLRDFGHTPRDLADDLAVHDYRLFEWNADADALTPYDPGTLPASGNVIATKDVDALRRRLAEVPAPAFARPPVDVRVEIDA